MSILKKGKIITKHKHNNITRRYCQELVLSDVVKIVVVLATAEVLWLWDDRYNNACNGKKKRYMQSCLGKTINSLKTLYNICLSKVVLATFNTSFTPCRLNAFMVNHFNLSFCLFIYSLTLSLSLSLSRKITTSIS